jgi:hypothetical protein
MTPITPDITGSGRIPDGVLLNVVVDAIGPVFKNAEGEARAALGMQ